MAGNDFKRLAARLRLRAKQVEDGAGRVVRKAAIAADQVAVLATPFDTGRARGGWLVSIGSPADGEGPPDKSGQSTIATGQDVISRYQTGAGPIFITNNVPYIAPLDQGSSKQAPKGMTTDAIQAAAAVVRRERLLK